MTTTTENQPDKKKKRTFDDEHGFEAMKNWSPALRWLLVLPIAIITGLLVNGLSAWAAKISTATWFLYTASTIFHTLAVALFIYYGAATAPKARRTVMIILAIIQIFFAITIFLIQQDTAPSFDLSMTNKILTIVSCILGILLAFVMAKEKPE